MRLRNRVDKQRIASLEKKSDHEINKFRTGPSYGSGQLSQGSLLPKAVDELPNLTLHQTIIHCLMGRILRYYTLVYITIRKNWLNILRYYTLVYITIRKNWLNRLNKLKPICFKKYWTPNGTLETSEYIE